MYYACVCVCVFSRIYISLRSLRNLNIIYVQSSRFSVGLFACCLPCPALPDPCTAPIRSDSGLRYPVPNEERSIHLNVCHLLRCRRNVCLFAASPALLLLLLLLPHLHLLLHLLLLLCLCLSLCYCFYLGKKRHRHRRHPSRPRPRSINAVVYLLDISETRPVQLS